MTWVIWPQGRAAQPDWHGQQKGLRQAHSIIERQKERGMEFTREGFYLLLNAAKPLWLVGADLSQGDLRWANLHKANLTRSDIGGADLRWANLSEAALIGANLSKSVLTEANLREADLRWANLSHAQLQGADLTGVNLSGASVTQEQLTEASSIDGAIMPDGTKRE
jgi:uncharacterized protein YjbI with pentapeptide repeats